jgi:hypothetical protein
VLLAVPATLAFDALFGNLLFGVPLAFTVNGWVDQMAGADQTGEQGTDEPAEHVSGAS